MTAHENKILGEGLTYDDVLLVPAYSEVLPRDVSIKTKFSIVRYGNVINSRGSVIPFFLDLKKKR